MNFVVYSLMTSRDFCAFILQLRFCLTGDWYSGLDLDKLVGIVFIDQIKVFDTVDHKFLSKKIALYGTQHRKLS